MATIAASPTHNALGKAARRLLPLLFVLYVINFVDRANISVAALAMNADLRLSATAYGTAAGVFFLGYVLFQVPANAALARFGAGRTLTAVVLAWGVCSAATALVTSAHTLYLARFALGVAEGGFFPGVIAYLTVWFPCAQRARAVATFLLAIPVANTVGLPLSGLIVGHVHMAGLPGWRAMFVIEALPALLLAPLLRRLLPDNPQRASWLTPEERAELSARLTEDTPAPTGRSSGAGWDLVLFAVVYGGLYFALYALQFFLPQLVASLAHGTATLTAATLAALPYGCRRAGHVGLEPPQHRPLGRPSGPYHTANNGRGQRRARCGIESDVTDSDAELADHRRRRNPCRDARFLEPLHRRAGRSPGRRGHRDGQCRGQSGELRRSLRHRPPQRRHRHLPSRVADRRRRTCCRGGL